jgi:hypothetical protein
MKKILIAATAALLAVTSACSDMSTTNTSNTVVTDYNASTDEATVVESETTTEAVQ